MADEAAEAGADPATRAQLYVSADEAVAMLDVSKATLYAYVSRGMIRSRQIPGSRKRRYWKLDIERLVASEDPNAPAVAAALVTDTRITLITDDGPYYRGRAAITLAETESFEAVASLLFDAGGASEIFSDRLPAVPKRLPELLKSLSEVSAIDRAIAAFPLIDRLNAKAYDLSPEGFARTGADILRWFAAILAGAAAPSAEPIPGLVAQSLRPGANLEDVLRHLLILIADHEFDPSTYAVRAVANTGVTPYHAAMTGLIAHRGRRLTTGRSEIVSRFVAAMITDPDPRDPILRCFRAGDPFPGFHSPVYPHDPRALSLMKKLATTFPDDEEFDRFRTALSTATELTGDTPDFILPAIFVGRKLGLQGQELAIAGLGRMAGWIAHAMEQYHEHELVRPRARYTGNLPE